MIEILSIQIKIHIFQNLVNASKSIQISPYLITK